MRLEPPRSPGVDPEGSKLHVNLKLKPDEQAAGMSRSFLIACAAVATLAACGSPRADPDAAPDRGLHADVARPDLAAQDGAAADTPTLDHAALDSTDAATRDAHLHDALPGERGPADLVAVDLAAADRALPDLHAPDLLAPDALVADAPVPDAVAADAGSADTSQAGSDAGADDGADASADATLGWPLDAALPARCPENPPDTSGSSWSGWANYQWPDEVGDEQGGLLVAGEQSEWIYGQVWQEGVTEAAGAAPGWSAELALGPYGTLPTGDGRCWQYHAASYNPGCDADGRPCGNNDEYRIQVLAPRPGLFALYFRYRPAGGQWLYGDRDSSGDGLQVNQAGRMYVSDSSAGRLVVATLNLRCRVDDWAARRPLVVAALARIQPDLLGLQEDCADADGVPQSEEIRAELATWTGRGYQLARTVTHQASYIPEGVFDEGVSVMSAHPIEAQRVLELPPTPPVPPANFGRRALAVELSVAGRPLVFYATHFEVGVDNVATRDGQAAALLADLPGDRDVLVVGDLNATPDEPAIARLRATLTDCWQTANPADPGLTMPAWDPTRRIDYIFARATGAAGLAGARLLDEHDGSTWLSDHRGVAAVLGWP